MAWYCPYEIERAEFGGGPGTVLVRRHAIGVDSVQALRLALFIAGTELGLIDGSPDPEDDFGPNFGFPASPRG